MTQAERECLVALKKASKKLITQKQAALELDITERHMRRLLRALKRRGDKAVVQRLARTAIESQDRRGDAAGGRHDTGAAGVPGFGPTLASEYLADKHDIEVSRETLRQWMIHAKLWRARRQRIEKVHEWRPRRSRWGELVQWNTSDHDWLEGRGDEMLLINMIEKHADGYVACPLGLKGVIVGEGSTYEEALADVPSAIRFHIQTYGPELLPDDSPLLEAFVAEATIPA